MPSGNQESKLSNVFLSGPSFLKSHSIILLADGRMDRRQHAIGSVHSSLFSAWRFLFFSFLFSLLLFGQKASALIEWSLQREPFPTVYLMLKVKATEVSPAGLQSPEQTAPSAHVWTRTCRAVGVCDVLEAHLSTLS